jgi:hypothetical protein
MSVLAKGTDHAAAAVLGEALSRCWQIGGFVEKINPSRIRLRLEPL